MAKWILVAFLVVPIIEIALFIQVGGLIGVLPTLLLVALAAIAGTALMRIQGLGALARLRASLDEGRDPAGAIAHGALIVVAGMLLLIPGFFTDALGLLLLVPALRSRMIGWAAGRLASRAAVRTRYTGPGSRPSARTTTIEADYEVLDDLKPPPRPAGRSGWTRPDG